MTTTVLSNSIDERDKALNELSLAVRTILYDEDFSTSVIRLLLRKMTDSLSYNTWEIVLNRDETLITKLLFNAVKNNDVKLIQLFLQHRANINVKNKNKDTPLTTAIIGSCNEIVRLLLEHGADVETNYQLRVAIEERNTEAARLLLERGAANVKHVTQLLKRDMDTLDDEMLRLLFEYGAEDVELDHHTEIVLERAIKDRHNKFIQLLLEHIINFDQDRNRLLHTAIEERNVEAVRLLLEHGADVETRNHAGETPLHVAIYNQDVEIVRLLLQHGAEVDAIAECNEFTPLEYVVYDPQENSEDIVQLLLEHGANIETTNFKGQTILIQAVRFPDRESEGIVRLLLEHGANVNATDDEGHTPLQLTSNNNIKQLLIEHGAKERIIAEQS